MTRASAALLGDLDLVSVKSDNIIYKLYRKLGSVIYDARSPVQLGKDTRTNCWFSIETPDVDAVRESVYPYRAISRSLYVPPFHVQVLLALPRLSRDEVLVHTSPDAQPELLDPSYSYILLETWTIVHVARTPQGHDEYLPHVTFKECASLLRSIYTMLRMVPAWRLDSRLTKQTHRGSKPKFSVVLRFDSGGGFPAANGISVPNFTSLAQESQTFTPVTHPTGVLQISVKWLQNPAFQVMDRVAYLSAKMEQNAFVAKAVPPEIPLVGTPPIPIRARTALTKASSSGGLSLSSAGTSYYNDARPRRISFVERVPEMIKRTNSPQPVRSVSTGSALLTTGSVPSLTPVIIPIAHCPTGTLRARRQSSIQDTPETPTDINSILTHGFSSSEDPQLVTLLRFVLSSADRLPILLHLDDSDAQFAVDAMQRLLNDDTFKRTGFTTKTDPNAVSHQMRRLLLKLVLKYDKLPRALFVSGVRILSENSWGGLGGFSDVFVGTYQGQRVAMKRLRVFQAMEDSKREDVKRSFYHEAITWRTLSHRHVLPFYGIDDKLFSPSLCMISPWMEHGTLRDTLDKLISKLKVSHKTLSQYVQGWIFQIARGLAYLHEENIVHGDLRCPNILVDSDMQVRLTDFGLSVFADGSSHGYASVRAGATRWLAPELIDPDEFGLQSSRPTFSSDVYSFGCVLIEMYTCKAPFADLDNDHTVIRRVMLGSRPPRPLFHGEDIMSDTLWNLTTRCWSQQSQDRPSAENIVQELKPMQT